MTGSIPAVITGGYGSWGSPGLVTTLGYGTEGGGGTVILPDPGDVRDGVVYDENNLPDPGDVRDGVVYGEVGSEMTGTLELPAESDVRIGVDYGADGTEFTGTLDVPSAGPSPGSSVLGGILELVASLETDAGFPLDGAAVPVVRRKLPKREEPVDGAAQITVNAIEVPDSIRRIAFGSVYQVKYRVDITLASKCDHDASIGLPEHSDWKEAVRARYQASGVLSSAGVKRVEIDTSPLLDRSKLAGGYDYSSVALSCWTYETR